MTSTFDVRVLLAILIFAVSTNSIYHKNEWVEYRPKDGLCGYNDNCKCDGKMRSACNACEGIGLRERLCTTECGVNSYTQFGLCVEQCDLTYPLYDSTCVAKCPNDTFITVKAGRSFCERCDTECMDCYGPSSAECNTCKHLMSFNKTCVSKCPGDQVTLGQRCITVNECPWVVLGGKCVQACPPDMYESHNHYCQKCHAECAGCIGPGNGNCKKCIGLQYEKNKTCVQYCPEEEPFQREGQCVLRCEPGDIVYKRKCLSVCPDHLFQYGDTCVTVCPQWQYIKDKKCVDHCDKLKIGRSCMDKCPTRMFRFNETCIWQCPKTAPYERRNECIPKCLHFLYNKKCLDSCPGNTVWFNKRCDHRCPSHSPISDPLTRECKTKCGYFHFAGECRLDCPDRLFKSNRECVAICPSNRQFVHNRTCVNSCKPPLRILHNYAEQKGNLLCELQCPGRLVEYNKTCVPQCPENTFPFRRKCISRCPKYTYNVNGDCVTQCPESSWSYELLLPGNETKATCVISCPAERPLELNKVCVKSCNMKVNDSTELRWYKDDSKCVPSCGYKFIMEEEMKCVYFCDDGMVKFKNRCIRCSSRSHMYSDLCTSVPPPVPIGQGVVFLLFSIIVLIILILSCYHTTQARSLSRILRQKPGDLDDLLSEIVKHRGREILDPDSTHQRILEIPSTSSDGATSEFLYDVFFSQSDEDEWVEHALEVLESEPYNLRCCYSQRDFVPGKPITSNIEDCITNSRCTVILFSPAFLDSAWCQMEHTLATTHTITKPGSVVVPIMLKPCELPISISTINYIDAAEGNVHEKIIIAVKSAAQKRTYTPFSQLQRAMASVIMDGSATAFIPLQDKEIYEALYGCNELESIISRLGVSLSVLHSAIKLIASEPLLRKRGYRCCSIGSNLRCLILFFILTAIGMFIYSIMLFLNGSDMISVIIIFGTVQDACFLVIPLVNVTIHFAGKKFEVVYSLMGINAPKRATSEIVNWILSKEYALLITWDYINCGCVLTTCDTSACRKYIEDKEDLKPLLHFDQENDERKKETSLMKGLLYEYAVRLRRREVLVPENERHRNDKTMCFCQFVEYMCCHDQSMLTNPRRNYRPRNGGRNGGYQRLHNAEVV